MKKKIVLGLMACAIVFGAAFAPAPSALAQAQNSAVQFDSPDYENRLESCSPFNLVGCLLRAYYYLILYPSHWFAYICGSIFDYFVAYSIDTVSYSGATSNEFVDKGWSVIRDIANVIFIFSLLYVAIIHIFQAGKSETKKYLIGIIIAALLINFSLFFTKVIIDAGNILARAFYNNIEVTNDDNVDHKTISQGLIEKVSPQKILSTDLFKPVDAPGRLPQRVDSGWAFLIMLMATVVNVMIGLTFLSTFLLFAARVIGLWFMMIFSPLAVASKALPIGQQTFGDFSFNNWLKQTLSLSFMAPVFMFFLFLLVMFLDIAFGSSVPTGDQSSVQKIMVVIIPFIAIIVIMNQAKNQAKDMAGKVGEAVVKWSGRIAGYTAMGALAVVGGAAMAARMTAGAAGTAISRSAMIRRGATSSNRFIRGASRFTRTAGTVAGRASFDPRNTWVGKKSTWLTQQAIERATGEKTSTKIFGTDFAKGAGVGGYRQFERDKVKEAVKKEKARAAENDLKESESDYLRRNKSRYEQAKKDRVDLEKLAEIRPLSEAERSKLKSSESLVSDYEKAQQEIKDINASERKLRADYLRSVGWFGADEAADAVEKGEKVKSEEDDMMEALRKFIKEEKSKNKGGGGGDSGGDGDGGGGGGGPSASFFGGGGTKSGPAYGEWRGTQPTAAQNININVEVQPTAGAKVDNVKVSSSTGNGTPGEFAPPTKIKSSGMTEEERKKINPIGFKRPSEME